MLQYIDSNRLKCISNKFSDLVFVIDLNVLRSICQFAQLDQISTEAGGLLIGHQDLQTKAFIVDKTTLPFPDDKRKRNSFYRSNSHSKELTRLWEESNKVITLGGLWHTHPEDSPSPSSTDYKDLFSVINSFKGLDIPLLYVIVGRREIGFWFGYNKNSEVEALGSIDLAQIISCNKY